MANFSFVNNVNTTLAAPITSTSQTTITLASSANLPTLSAGQMMSLTLNDAATRAVFEIVYVTAISGATLTVIRGQEGTAATTWLVGDLTYSALTAGVIENLQTASAAAIGRPSGRLALASGIPYPQSNVINASSVYYTPAGGATLPIYNGSSLVATTFTEQLQTLTSGNNLSGHNYDVFAYLSGSTVLIGTGPAWTNLTTRSAAIDESIGGFATNSNPIVLTNGATTTGSIPAGEAMYLGTIFCTANAQTGMNLQPSPASGGTANVLGIYNAYNRARLSAVCADTGSNVGTGSGWLHLGANDIITIVDGLQQSQIDVQLLLPLVTSSGSTSLIAEAGFNLDSTVATPSAGDFVLLQTGELSGESPLYPVVHRNLVLPQLGTHTINTMIRIATSDGATSFTGANSPHLTIVSLEM